MSTPTFEGWAVVELLGHRVRYGRVSEVTMFGEAFCRIEIPSEPPAVEFYSGKALYGIRPVSEETIRAYHTPRPALTSGERVVDDDDWDDYRPSEPSKCGGCSEPLGAEPTVRVADHEDSDASVLHERCAKEHAERVVAPVDDIDAECAF